MATEIEALLRSRGEAHRLTPPAMPAGFSPRGMDDEEPERQADDAAPIQDLVGAAFGIDYVDARGRESRRRITVRGIVRTRDGAVALDCFCHERRAPRRFLLERIEAFIDLHTGVVHGDIAAFVPGAAQMIDAAASEMSAAETAVIALRPGLNALLFIATCDGLHGSEVDVLCRYVRDSPVASDCTGDAEVLAFVAALHPDEAIFHRALAALTRSGKGEMARVGRYVTRLIDADGAISDAEFRFALALRDALDRSGERRY